jgi:hypothetical protein
MYTGIPFGKATSWDKFLGLETARDTGTRIRDMPSYCPRCGMKLIRPDGSEG